jgi:amino acid adenylation domain-containing protein
MRAGSAPMPVLSLPDIVDQWAAERANAAAYRFLGNGEDETGRLTFAVLAGKARGLAGWISRTSRPGERALLAYPAGLDFPVAFLACLYAGVIAVPADVPRRREGDGPLTAIVRNSGPTLFLSHSTLRDRLPDFGVQWHFTDEWDGDRPANSGLPAPAADSIAYLQYTSGSTRAPRGAAISHRALMQQLDDYCHRGGGVWRDMVLVSWLPHTHDFGLVGFILCALYAGRPLISMPPSAFLRRPVRWLEAISRYRGSYCGAPSFGYELCATVGADTLAGEIDLSCWRIASLGGDYIAPHTLARFEAAFTPFGFSHAAWLPAYGLAESVLCATGRQGAEVKAFDAAALRMNRAVPANDDQTAVHLVSCGRPVPDQYVSIVDPDTRALLPDSQVGEIWLAGRSLADGYWNDAAATQAAFGATLQGDRDATPHLRTGDCGFRHAGELFITGRLNDLIVVRGKNHAPDDVELTIQSVHPALRAGCGAVVQTEQCDGARLIAIQEVLRDVVPDHSALAATINRAVTGRHGLALDEIVLIRAGSLPRTRNGKISRPACLAALADGSLRRVNTWHRLARTSPLATVSAVQCRLLGRLRQMLPNRIIAADQDLFELGLDSLSIHVLLGWLQTDFGVELPVKAVFSSPTVAAIAAIVADRLGPEQTPPAMDGPGKDWADVSPADVLQELRQLRLLVAEQTRLLGLLTAGMSLPVPVAVAETTAGAPFPLNDTQREISLLSELHDDADAVCNILMVLEHAGPLDIAALRLAYRAVAMRHEALRTAFQGHQQRVLPFVDPIVEEDEVTTGEALRTWLRTERRRPFALQRAPLWRVTVLHASETRYLVLTAHHLVLDGSSLSVLVRDLLDRFADPPSVDDEAPRPMQFREFCSVNETHRRHSDRQALAAYWRDQLGDQLPDWVRPGDGSGRPVTRFDADVHTITLDDTLRTLLVRRGAAAKATLFHTLLAAGFVLLHRVSGQERIVIGIDAANRTGPHEADVIGCCNILLPVVADFADATTVQDLLVSVREHVLQAIEHRDYTMTMWQEDQRIAPDFTRPFKITACMNMQRFPSHLGAFRPRFDLEAQSISQSPFGLAFDVRDQDDSVRIDFVYNTQLLDAAQVARFAACYRRLLDGMARDGETDVLALPMLSVAETERLLSWRRAEQSPAPFVSFIENFAETVARVPDNEAISCPDQRLTYRALSDRASQLSRIIASEVPPGTVVGLLSHRGCDFLAAMLAILKAGCLYLPLDPRDLDTRLTCQLIRADAALLLHDSGHRDIAAALRDASGGQRKMLCVDAMMAGGFDTAAEPLVPAAQADTPAYLLFTSGSTGEPKAATISVGGMVNHLRAKIDALELTAADTVAQTASQSFDISVWQYLAPLLVGGRVCVFDDRSTHDPAALFAETDRQAITVLQTVPSILRASIEILARPDQRCPLRALRWLISTGEALPADLCRRWISLYPRVPMMNAYGPTECSDDVTHHVVEWPPAADVVRVPIGRPIPGAELYVLDRIGGLAPIGSSGELYIGGPCVGLGYRNDSARTDAAFVPDTISHRPGARLYRTGDLVLFRNDGTLDYLGRLDQQVKINGVRVEPREIEVAIQRDPAVLQSLVTVTRAADGRDTLVAYIVLRPGKSALVGGLKAAARRSLPASLVPSAFVFLDAMPITPNGKIDLAKLPAPERRPRLINRTPPSSDIETTLLRIWSDTIGRGTSFGVHEDFFDLGGRSVDAAALAKQIEDNFKIRLPVSTIFRTPTIAGLAVAIQALSSGQNGNAIPSCA